MSLIGLFVVLALLVQYRDLVISGLNSSRNFISDLLVVNPDYTAKINSKYGFAVRFDTRVLYANAVDGGTGRIYQNRELMQERAYSKIQFVPLAQRHVSDQSAVTIAYHAEVEGPLTSERMQDLAFSDIGLDKNSIRFVTSEKVRLGGHEFEKSVWQTKQSIGNLKNLNISFSVYVAEVNGHPLVIAVNEGFVDIPGTHPQYDDLIRSLEFMPQTARLNKQPVISHMGGLLFDTILMAQTASADTARAVPTASERIAAMYAPAVVRVYNIFCGNIEFDNEAIFRDACQSRAGSGFIVSQDGYIATNGHVASMNARDLALYNAFIYAVMGDPRLLNLFVVESGFKESDVPKDATDRQAAGLMVKKLYEIEDSRFTFKDSVQNLLVVLGDKNPDQNKLITDTKARVKYEAEPSIKHAEVKATDYRLLDGIDGFHASDVAIIKVEGKDYPIVSLGSIDNVAQGSELMILGFPGIANDSGLVDSDVSIATLTTGKVSSKKKAAGSNNQLIETDTVIGHGNSGGPAFSDQGDVIGIATYTLDGSGTGDGTYNYIRDIKDLIDLADRSSISFDTNSATQNEWKQGLDYFYEARYSKALVNFKKVKELYPLHNKAAELIATAKKRIANGEDVQDFPLELVVVVLVVLLAGAGMGVFMIVRHKKHHDVYNAGVAQGVVTPFAKGESAPPQNVHVSHAVAPSDAVIQNAESSQNLTPDIESTQPTTSPTASSETPQDPIGKNEQNLPTATNLSDDSFENDTNEPDAYSQG